MTFLNKNWSTLIKPSKLEVVNHVVNQNQSRFVLEPLERGFGVTIGNALRRILLSSLQGSAVTAIKIPSVLHEFSSIQGMKEDLIDVVLNIKSMVIKMNSYEKKIVKLNVKGPCIVTAGMITTTSDVEIIDPDHIICTLDNNAKLEMELICETGKGYIPATVNKDENIVGIIRIDALFNPIKKVTYFVEDTRVGQITDYDKLIIDIETNGALTPEIACGIGARILQDQLQVFINFEEDQQEEENKIEILNKLPFSATLLKKVDELELSVRSQNCLKNDNIVYIGDLVIKTESEMLKTQNFGRKSLNEIKDILSRYGLKFGMDVPEWPLENLEEISKKYEEPY